MHIDPIIEICSTKIPQVKVKEWLRPLITIGGIALATVAVLDKVVLNKKKNA